MRTSPSSRQRCCSGNHNPATTIEASSSSAVAVITDANDVYADQKYDKRVKARLQQQKRRRRLAQQQVNRIWQRPSKTTVAQMAGFLMLLTALFTVWRYIRTVRWASHVRHARLKLEQEPKSMYQLAEERIRQIQNRHANGAQEIDMELYRRQQQKQHFHHAFDQYPQQKTEGSGNDEHDRSEIEKEQRQHRGRKDEGGDKEKQEMDLEMLLELSNDRLQEVFLQERHKKSNGSNGVMKILRAWLHNIDRDILNNVHGGVRWILPTLLPSLPGQSKQGGEDEHQQRHTNVRQQDRHQENSLFFKAKRMATRSTQFKWEVEWNAHLAEKADASATITRKLAQPVVDYTSQDKYRYPLPLLEKPPLHGEYPQLTTLSSMIEHWDQDEDYHGTITETLMHFNFSDPNELEMARNFRDAELPFKLYDVPEIAAANLKWTDKYVSKQFDEGVARGHAQESPNHYFAYFTTHLWDVETMGVPPVRNNDWTFHKWSQHAKYADAFRLRTDRPHFYWQAGVDREDLNLPEKERSFISRDLPSFLSPTETFVAFHPESQQGIECRFGERGVAVSTHYDAGRNMVGMITGAKRYILSPPKACSKLGITTSVESPIFRQSLLNFGHLKYLNNSNHESGESSMSKEERAWLERAAQAEGVETVLKAGEVLYLPSFWFHYIISLQKSAQCNVRSGVETNETGEFGGKVDVLEGMC